MHKQTDILMKNLIFYLIVGLWSIPLLTQAQDTPFQEFRKEAEDFSMIYSGKTVSTYNRFQYYNLPYWETEEYRNGTLCYQGRIYTDVPLRYDLYQNELNILLPKRIGVNVDKRKVNYFILNKVMFVPYEGGYQLILHPPAFYANSKKLHPIFLLPAHTQQSSPLKNSIFYNLTKFCYICL